MSADEDEALNDDGWVDEAEFVPGDDVGEGSRASDAPSPPVGEGLASSEDEHDEHDEHSDEPERPTISAIDDLSDVVPAAIACLRLAETDSPHVHLAESALWLALSCLGEQAREPLEAFVDGRAWEELRPGRVDSPPLQRLALGLILQRSAANPAIGVAPRAAAALAAVALGCADPSAGEGLQRGFSRMRLLEITEQIPVALPIRMLSLEFRHLRLAEPIPAGFIARVEDLLDRLDHQALLPLQLSDHPDERPHDAPGEGLLEALVRSRAPSLRSLARALLTSAAPRSAEDLLAALAEATPASWDLPPEDARRALTLRYASLRALLAGTPFALTEPEHGYGVSASCDSSGSAG